MPPSSHAQFQSPFVTDDDISWALGLDKDLWSRLPSNTKTLEPLKVDHTWPDVQKNDWLVKRASFTFEYGQTKEGISLIGCSYNVNSQHFGTLIWVFQKDSPAIFIHDWEHTMTLADGKTMIVTHRSEWCGFSNGSIRLFRIGNIGDESDDVDLDDFVKLSQEGKKESYRKSKTVDCYFTRSDSLEYGEDVERRASVAKELFTKLMSSADSVSASAEVKKVLPKLFPMTHEEWATRDDRLQRQCKLYIRVRDLERKKSGAQK